MDTRLNSSAVSGDEFINTACSVANYAYKEDTNYRFRPSMEDGRKIVDSFMGDSNSGFFALFDGHGGKEAVEYCIQRIDIEFQKAMNESGNNVEQAFIRCFSKVDDQLRMTGAMNSGTTATVSLIRKEGSAKVLYVANVGDSKAVLVRRNETLQLSYEHKGTDPREIDRIL